MFRGGRLASVAIAIIVLGGALATAAVARWAAHAPGTYWARTQVRFIAPAIGRATANDVLTPPTGVIMTAQAVARIVDPSRAPRVSSEAATLAGLGVKHGQSVVLPNTGGQWANQFVSPFLDVQVVGTDAAEVTARSSRLIARIESTLAALEDRSHVPPTWRIRTQLSPLGAPPLRYEQGSSARAAAATLVLGLGLTLGAAAATRRLLRRSRPAV